MLHNKEKLQPGGASQLNVTLSKYDKREDGKKTQTQCEKYSIFLSDFFNSKKRGASEICTSSGSVSGFGVQRCVLRSNIPSLDLATRALL